jgi:hypothetical protein
VQPGSEGHLTGSPDEFAGWLATCGSDELAEPFTFVVGLDGILRVAPRRSEHVGCAAGAPVLSAGEITLSSDQGHWKVTDVSNQSAGYCPDPASWPAVSDALDRAGLEHPGRFTHPVVFRRCPRCQERNLVKDDYFACVICGAELPRTWNVDPLGDPRRA